MLKQALQLNPRNADALNNYALLLLNNDASHSSSDNTTLRHDDSANDDSESTAAHAADSDVLICGDSTRAAIIALEMALANKPADATIWNNLAVAYHAQGEKQCADTAFQKVTTAPPPHTACIAMLCDCTVQQCILHV